MNDEFEEHTRRDIRARVREGVKAVFEEVLEEEMTEHLRAEHRERTDRRRGQRNGHYTRDLITPVGKVEQLRVPRDREATFLTEVFEKYRRMTGDMEEAVLEMYLQGVSTRKIARITGRLSDVAISKDATSRLAGRLEEELTQWRSRRLEKSYPYLYLDATYLKSRWAGAVRDLALLVAVGVDEDGYREVLACQSAAGERKAAWREVLKDLLERGLKGVRLVISDDHEAIKKATAVELPQARWQRCVVHFERNILAHVPQSEARAVAADLKAVFKVHRQETARTLAEDFAERYRSDFPKATQTLERGLEEALTFMAFPTSHHRFLRTTNMLERLFREVKRRTKVVGVFPSAESATNLSTTVMLRVSEDWSQRRYLNTEPLHALFHKPTTLAT